AQRIRQGFGVVGIAREAHAAQRRAQRCIVNGPKPAQPRGTILKCNHLLVVLRRHLLKDVHVAGSVSRERAAVNNQNGSGTWHSSAACTSNAWARAPFACAQRRKRQHCRRQQPQKGSAFAIHTFLPPLPAGPETPCSQSLRSGSGDIMPLPFILWPLPLSGGHGFRSKRAYACLLFCCSPSSPTAC